MASNKTVKPAKPNKKQAAPAQLPPPPPPPQEEEEEEQEEEQDDDDDDDDDDGSNGGNGRMSANQIPGAIPGPGMFISGPQDAELFKGFDEESQRANIALESALMRKSNGESRVPFNARGAHKYDGAAEMFATTEGSNARVLIQQVHPKTVDKDHVPLSLVPSYLALFNYIRDRHWKGDDVTYKWIIYTRGHMQQAQDLIVFEADPFWQAEYRRKTQALGDTGAQPQQQPIQQSTTYPSQPQAQMVPPPQHYAPPLQQYGQQPQQYAQAPQQQYPQYPAPQPPPHPYAQQDPYAQQPPAMGQQFGGQQWGQQGPQAGHFGAPPGMPISFNPPGHRQRAATTLDDQDFDPPEEQQQEETQDDPDNPLARRLEELEGQLMQMREQLVEQNRGTDPAPAAQASMSQAPETVQIHRPRPMDPSRMQRVVIPPPVAPAAPAPNPQPPPQPQAQDWQQFMVPPVHQAARVGPDPEMLFDLNRQLASLSGRIEGLRSTVIEDRKMHDQQSKVMQNMRDMQMQVDQMSTYLGNLYAQSQQVAAAQTAAAIAAQAAAAAPAPAPVPAPPRAQSPQPQPQVGAQGYPQQAGPQQAQDPSQLGIFGAQQFAQNPASYPQQPHQPMAPAAPPKKPMEAMFEQLDETLQTVKGLQKFAVSFGMVPAPQAAPNPAPPPPAPEPEPRSALASAASMAAGVASVASGEQDPFTVKEFGGFRAVFTKEGKLADWVTHLFLNMDNLGGIIKNAQAQIAEARKHGENENRLVLMEREVNRLRSREQSLQSQVQSMQQQAQQAMLMPPMDVESFVDAPPPPMPSHHAVAPQDVVASEPSHPIAYAPAPSSSQHVGSVAAPASPAPSPAGASQSGGLIESMEFADSLLD